jgi:hypothetical protein
VKVEYVLEALPKVAVDEVVRVTAIALRIAMFLWL